MDRLDVPFPTTPQNRLAYRGDLLDASTTILPPASHGTQAYPAECVSPRSAGTLSREAAAAAATPSPGGGAAAASFLGRTRTGARAVVFACIVLTAALPARATLDQSGSAAGEVVVPQRLSLANALDLFHAHGFDLLIADAAVQRARGDLLGAAALPNPLVQAGGGTAFNYSCPPAARGCSPTQFTTGVSDQGLLTDLALGKRRLRVAVAEKALAAAQLARADAERTLTFLIKQQYAQVVMAKAALRSTTDAAQMSAETARLVGVRLRAGAVSEADVARAETEQLEAQQSVDAANEALATAKASLAFLIGVRHGAADFDVDDDLARTVEPTLLSNASVDSLLPMALAARPDLQAARVEAERADAAVDLARRLRLPDVALYANYQSQGSGQDAIQPPTLSLGVSVPLPIFYRQQGEIAAAEAERQAGVAQSRKAEAQVREDVATALAAYQSARQRLERMDSGLLARARRARDLVEVQYQKGAASLLELLDAQRTFVATTSEYQKTVTDYWTALFQVEAAVGKDLSA